jgi:hypothetical protein
MDVDMGVHGVLRPDACDGIKGDCQRDSNLHRRHCVGCLLSKGSDSDHLCRNVVVEVEELLALISMNIGLITIVAEPLTSTPLIVRSAKSDETAEQVLLKPA